MKNIIFITIDCLRSDSLGITNPKVKTPFIDKLAKKGVFFKNAIASSPWSGGSAPSIFTGEYPFSSNGAISLANRGKSFVEILKNNGYTTIGVHSNPFFTAENNYDKGFDYFYDWYTSSNEKIHKVEDKLKIKKRLKRFIEKNKVLNLFLKFYETLNRKIFKKIRKSSSASYAGACKINEIALKAVNFYRKKASKKNFFIWLHYMDCHEPISIPDKFLSKDIRSRVGYLNSIYRDNSVKKTQTNKKQLKQLYWDSIKYVDRRIGEIVSEIEKNLKGEILIILTADHGQGFGEKDDHFGHGIIHSKELLSVPLIFSRTPVQKTIERFVPLQAIGNSILEVNKLSLEFGELNSFIDKKFEVFPPNFVISEEGREKEKDFLSNGQYKLNWDKRSFGVFKDNMYYSYNYKNNSRKLYNFKKNTRLNLSKHPKERKFFSQIISKHLKKYKRKKVVDKIKI